PGTIAARFYTMEFMNSNGIYVDGNGSVDITNNFSDGSFTNGLAGGTYLRIENSQDFLDSSGEAIQNVVFNDNPGGGAVSVTKTVGTSGTIEFDNYTGEFSGESFDSDPNDLISWLIPPVLTWTGGVSTDWFSTGNWQDELGNPITNAPGTNTTTDYTNIDIIIPSSPTQATLNPPVIGDNATVIEIGGNLSIDGNTLTINTSDADADSDIRITGAITLDDATFRSLGSDDDIEIGGGLTLNGSSLLLPGTGSLFTFNSTGGLVTIEPSSAFNNLTIDVVGTFSILSNLEVTGDLTLSSGIGSFDFNGFDVSVSGNFVNNSASASSMIPGTNTLNLTPSSSPLALTTGPVELYDVVIGDGTVVTYNLGSALSLSNTLSIAANTTLDLNGFGLIAGDDNADVEVATLNGNLTVDGGETISFGNGTSFSINGNLQLAGASDASRANLTRKGSTGSYSVTVNSGGEFGAQFFNVSFIGGNGIELASGSTLTVNSTGTEDIDTPAADGNDDIVLRNGSFTDGLGSAYLTLANSFSGTYKSDNVSFGSGPTSNVSRNGLTNAIVFVDPGGSLQGPSFEDDDASATTGNVQWFYNNPLFTWVGDTDSDWTDNTNWFDESAGSQAVAAPTNANTVNIPVVTMPNVYPEIDSDGLSVADLSIASGAQLSLTSGNTFTVEGDVVNSGTLNLDGTLNVEGTFTNTGTIVPGAGSTITQVLSSDILFDGGSAFSNLVFDGAFTVTTSGSVTVNNNLTITNNANLVIGDDSHVITVGGDFTIDEANGGAFGMTVGTVVLNGSGAQLIDNTSDSPFTFNNLTLSGGTTKTFGDNATINGELILNDNMTILDLGTTTLTLNSDLTVNDGASVNASASTVILGGSDVQRISGSGASTNVTFNNLSVNNSTTGSSDIQLGVDTNITGTLDFQTGIITSSASNPIIFNDNATVAYDGTPEVAPAGIATDGNSYVTGPVLKIGDEAFVFPVGEGERHSRLSISGITGAAATDEYSAEYFFTTPAAFDSTKNGGMARVSGLEYWDLSNLNAHSGQPLVTLFWDATSEVTDLNSLTVAHFNGTSWDNEGRGSTTGDATAGTITSSNNLTSFSPIALATTDDAANPLPVDLVQYTAIVAEDQVSINWVTASELNNEYFEVFHSSDGESFTSIGRVDGNGTTNEQISYSLNHKSPLLGDNYYQLRQYDFDGTETNHGIRMVYNDRVQAVMDITIYPNPGTSENLRLRISSGDNHTPISVSIIDLNGAVRYKSVIDGALSVDQQLEMYDELSSGIYYLLVEQGSQVSRKKLIIK
ncbi:MAG: T9SS type A sorting domain-containing protein, partial [Ekhidna sp.]|nr:T9SS type A sorting domain-containing protein [Ekhidna sp.]